VEDSDEDESIPSSDEEGESSAEEDEDSVPGNNPSLQGNIATAGAAATTGAAAITTTDPAAPSIDPAPNAATQLGVGPIVGIVFGIFVAFVFIGLFFYRRRMIQKRKALRGKWAIKPFEIGTPKDFRKGDENMMGATQNMVQVSAIASLPSPNLSRGSAVTDAPPQYMTSKTGSMNKIAPDSKIVKHAFVPTRPDELQVEMGDRLRVLKEYDDGWASCVNMSASSDADQNQKQGMVPMACWSSEDIGTGGAGAEENGRGIGDDDKKLKLSRRVTSLADGRRK
jgi:hypothetical protein